MQFSYIIATSVVIGSCLTAAADITITQDSSAPIYTDVTLNFDEPGGPTGVISETAFQADYGITIGAGDGVSVVDDFTTTVGPWVGTGNSFFGNFGVFMTFDTDVTNFSAQVWDPSGPPSPFGGGLGVFVFLDGVEIASTFVEPAWGGLGDEWFDISGSGGMVFDEVRILGFGFGPTTFIDNMSWNVVPTPGALAVLALGACCRRRRRN